MQYLSNSVLSLVREVVIMGEVIVVTGGKGGIGKTTVAVNLGRNLAAKNKRVLLVDADFGLRKLDLLLNLDKCIKYDIDDVINNRCDTNDAILSCDSIPNLFLLPGSMNVGATSVSIEDFDIMIKMYKREYDYVIVDCPAGVDSGFRLAIVGADRALVVIGQDVSAVRDANRVIGLLRLNNIKYEMVINYVNTEQVKTEDTLTVDIIEDAFGKSAFCLIPKDKNIPTSVNTGMEIPSTALVYKYFINLADRVVDSCVPRLEIKKQSAFARFMQAFR